MNKSIWGGLEFVKVPAGSFLMGSKKDKALDYGHEEPQHELDIPYDYWIGRFPITNAQYAEYAEFIEAVDFIGMSLDSLPVTGWKNERDHPVVYVFRENAISYCLWLNELRGDGLPEGNHFRLPTEAEWEKAARGVDGREWPWGNEFDKTKCNSIEGRLERIMPVGAYSPQGDSPYGCADMAGNIWEWTHSLFKPYPYKAGDGRENEDASIPRVLRGGSFDTYCMVARSAFRCNSANFLNLPFNNGFRVVVAPPISEIIKS